MLTHYDVIILFTLVDNHDVKLCNINTACTLTHLLFAYVDSTPLIERSYVSRILQLFRWTIFT